MGVALPAWVPAWLRGREAREWISVVLVISVVFGLITWLASGEGNKPGNYLVGIVLIMSVYALLALGLSVEVGYAGLPNFGHVAFMGLGAYGMAIFSSRMGGTLAPHLEGGSAWGTFATVLVALLAALLLYVPLLLVASRVRSLSPRVRLLVALVPALLFGAWLWTRMNPLSSRDAESVVVLLGVFIGMAVAAVAALLLGLASLRLREDYLAIVTLGFAEIMRLFALNEVQITNGSAGIQDFHRPIVDWARGTQWWRDLSERLDLLHVSFGHAAAAVLAVVVVFILVEALARSPWGRVLKAIREDEDVASALGKNVLWYKLQALMVGSAIAALAGVFFVWNIASVVPEHFLPAVTFYTFAMLVLGGVGNHKGAILGAVIIWGVIEIAGNLNYLEGVDIDFAGPLQSMFVGLLLILVVMFRPQGAVGNKEELSHGK